MYEVYSMPELQQAFIEKCVLRILISRGGIQILGKSLSCLDNHKEAERWHKVPSMSGVQLPSE